VVLDDGFVEGQPEVREGLEILLEGGSHATRAPLGLALGHVDADEIVGVEGDDALDVVGVPGLDQLANQVDRVRLHYQASGDPGLRRSTCTVHQTPVLTRQIKPCSLPGQFQPREALYYVRLAAVGGTQGSNSS